MARILFFPSSSFAHPPTLSTVLIPSLSQCNGGECESLERSESLPTPLKRLLGRWLDTTETVRVADGDSGDGVTRGEEEPQVRTLSILHSPPC